MPTEDTQYRVNLAYNNASRYLASLRRYAMINRIPRRELHRDYSPRSMRPAHFRATWTHAFISVSDEVDAAFYNWECHECGDYYTTADYETVCAYCAERNEEEQCGIRGRFGSFPDMNHLREIVAPFPRAVGIEFELTGSDYDTLSHLLPRIGAHAKDDGSIDGDGSEVELAFYPRRERLSVEILSRISQRHRQGDRSCGVHIHVDCDEEPSFRIQRLESYLLPLVGPQRLSTILFGQAGNYFSNAGQNYCALAHQSRPSGTRYVTVNIHAYDEHQTVEYRLFPSVAEGVPFWSELVSRLTENHFAGMGPQECMRALPPSLLSEYVSHIRTAWSSSSYGKGAVGHVLSLMERRPIAAGILLEVVPDKIISGFSTEHLEWEARVAAAVEQESARLARFPVSTQLPRQPWVSKYV